MTVKLFNYKRGNSVLHRIPALFKIFFLFLLCIMAFWGSEFDGTYEVIDFQHYIILETTSFFCIVLFILGGGSFSAFAVTPYVVLLGFFVTVLRGFSFVAVDDETIKFVINEDGMISGSLYTWRFFVSALSAQVIFETTSSLEIKNAMESVENWISKIIPPLKKLHLAFIISLTITFIPEIFETWEKVRLASKARSPKKKNLLLRIQNSTQELVAVFSILLSSAEIKRKTILNRSKEDF